MTAKSASTASTTDTQGETTSATAFPEASRQQVARSNDWIAAAFRAGEAVQQVNLQMSQRAALLHTQAADNARRASSPTELFQIQSTLLMYEWQEMTRYSQELMLACARAVGQPAGTSEQAAADAAKGTVGLADAAIGAAAPMVQAWQQVFSGMVPEPTQARH
jgi:hypothetical protein